MRPGITKGIGTISFRALLLAPLFLTALFFPNASASLDPRLAKGEQAFDTGERLTYNLTYLGLQSGTAVLEVKEKVRLGQRDAYHLVSTAQSNDFVSLFFPVDDLVESYMDADGLFSYNIKVHQHEGKRVRDKTIVFDQIRHKAVQIKESREQIFDVPPQVQDSLSSLYFFRAGEPLEVGRSVFIDVHESEKNWKLEIQVLGKEWVNTPVGIFNTFKVKALVRYDGLFMDKGDVYIWFTDDDKRIPVQMVGKVKIGTVTARLISRKNGKKGAQRVNGRSSDPS